MDRLVRLAETIARCGTRKKNLAEYLGMPQPRLSECLAGKRDFSADDMRRVAQFFKESPQWLFGKRYSNAERKEKINGKR